MKGSYPANWETFSESEYGGEDDGSSVYISELRKKSYPRTENSGINPNSRLRSEVANQAPMLYSSISKRIEENAN